MTVKRGIWRDHVAESPEWGSGKCLVYAGVGVCSDWAAEGFTVGNSGDGWCGRDFARAHQCPASRLEARHA